MGMGSRNSRGGRLLVAVLPSPDSTAFNHAVALRRLQAPWQLNPAQHLAGIFPAVESCAWVDPAHACTVVRAAGHSEGWGTESRAGVRGRPKADVHLEKAVAGRS